MKNFFLITLFVLVGCTGYQPELLPTITPTRIPTNTSVPSHTSRQATRVAEILEGTTDQAELTDSEKEEVLLSLIEFIIHDQPKLTESLQKHLPNIDLEIKRDVISFSTGEIIDDFDEHRSLVLDLVFAASLASTEHGAGDWGINRIEFTMNGKFGTFHTTFVDGHAKIVQIGNSSDAAVLADLLEYATPPVPKEENEATSIPGQAELTDSEKEEFLLSYLEFLIQDQPTKTRSLQKYLPNIDLEIKQNVITYSTQEVFDDPEEFASLVFNLFIAASIASTTDELGDWGIDRIEFITPESFFAGVSSITTFVDGHSKIVQISNASDHSILVDALETEVNY